MDRTAEFRSVLAYSCFFRCYSVCLKTVIITLILSSRLSRNSKVYCLRIQWNRDVNVPSRAITHESVYDHVVQGYEWVYKVTLLSFYVSFYTCKVLYLPNVPKKKGWLKKINGNKLYENTFTATSVYIYAVNARGPAFFSWPALWLSTQSRRTSLWINLPDPLAERSKPLD